MKNLFFCLLLICSISVHSQSYFVKFGNGNTRDSYHKEAYLKSIKGDLYYFYINSESSSYSTCDVFKIRFKSNVAHFDSPPYGKFILKKAPKSLDVRFENCKGCPEPKMGQYSGRYFLKSNSVPKTVTGIDGVRFSFDEKSYLNYYKD